MQYVARFTADPQGERYADCWESTAATLLRDCLRAENPYQAAARTKKAIRLAVTIRAAGGTSDSAAAMGPAEWSLASQAAGVNPPSSETIAEVISTIRLMESATKKFDGDPFPED